MTTHLFIITGASRGMGLALAQACLSAQNTVIGISRKVNDGLTALASKSNAPLQQWPLDLQDSIVAYQQLAAWLAKQAPNAFASATLINNAALLTTPSPLSDAIPAEHVAALRVGLEAPLLLTAAFIKGTEGWTTPAAGSAALPMVRKVMNISSGLGRNAMASSANYAATKAGMDHFTRCVALEEALKPHGAKVCSIAPGVIDTDMQVNLRSANPAQFPDRHRFVGMKEQGQLASPADAAAKLLVYLARPDFGTKAVADVRDAA
jgi:benzil reductase ((S)-benzoin forming)